MGLPVRLSRPRTLRVIDSGAPIDTLVRRLDLEALDVNLFRGYTPNDGRPRVYGGLVAAQALTAACRTVEDKLPHSLHSYFLLAGDPTTPILFHVDRIRDGRSFATRRVVAVQRGEAIFNLSVSFHREEPGDSYQVPMPEAPAPESIPSSVERLRAYGEATKNPVYEFLLHIERPVDQRDIDHIDDLHPEPFRGAHRRWFRADGPLGDDPMLHRAVLAYASDSGLLDSSINVHGYTWHSPELMVASLDHAIWFHRPFRADRWLLYVTECTNTEGARGLNHGRIYTQDGTLVASVAQEALMRHREKR